MPEIPVLPTKAERVDPPAEFDVLQHQAKAFDQILCNMADVVDMTDKLADAAKKAGSDKGEDAAHRKARSHRVLQPIVNEAVRVAYPMVIIQSDAAAPRYERGNYTYKPAG